MTDFASSQTAFYIGIFASGIGVLAGAILQYIIQSKIEQKKYEREQEEKTVERKQAKEDEKAEFQRETYQHLSDELLKLDEALRKVYLLQKKEKGTSHMLWEVGEPMTPYESEVSNEFLNTLGKMTLLRVRVQDEGLQKDLQKLCGYAAVVLFAKTQQDKILGFKNFSEDFFPIAEKLGNRKELS